MGEDEFGTKIGRLTKSSTYLEYCQRIYGYREYFFNMTDKEQLDYILNSIPVSSEDIIAEIGCANGSVLSLLTAKYGCNGIGIDRLDKSVFNCKDGRTAYINADIDNISDCRIKPAILLSVDSLYFSKDLNDTIGQLKSLGCKRMYFFYSQYIFDEAATDKSILLSDKTKLARALQSNGILFKTIDYSENERRLYQNSLPMLREYKKAFAAEGNTDLYEQKYKEDLLGAELYRKGLAARYLYIIEAGDTPA